MTYGERNCKQHSLQAGILKNWRIVQNDFILQYFKLF
jgi:hypothetical protein